MEYDYIIVGAGTAGCILASRLSANPRINVLLVEAGGSDQSIIIKMPAAVPLAYQKKALNWGYQSGPEPYLNNRTLDEKRGKVIGGSSSINAMIFNRGNPLDFEGWAEQGLPDWSYANVLPYFKKMETFSGGTDDWRGGDGPMMITRCSARHKMFDCFLRGGEQAGHHVTSDHNGYRQEGLHISQTLIGKGERWTTARGYLHAAKDRENLSIWRHAFVQKVTIEDGVAVGIEILQNGETKKLRATKEVILSAGAFNSPKLLMLSGVGPAEELRKHGITVKHDVRQVGKNLENHVAASVMYEAGADDSLAKEFSFLKRAQIGADWLFRRKGLGATSFYETGGFIRTRDDVPFPNIQYEFLPFMRRLSFGRLKAIPGFMIYFQGCRPANRGEVSLTSADPAAAPSIVLNHLNDRQDVQDLIDALRIAREMVAQPAWDGVRGREVQPGVDLTSDAELEKYIRNDAGTCYHPCGTCKMGPDDSSVVDSEGRVNAVKSLRIVDASIIPRVTTGNISASIMMIAEKVSDRILEKQPLPPSNVEFFSRVPVAEMAR